MRRLAVLVALPRSTHLQFPRSRRSARQTRTSTPLARAGRRYTANPPMRADNEKSCRAYAASFYEFVMLRQAAADRVDGARVLVAIDSVINAFNDLLTTKCGG